ncbi:MAG TPA: hypothetical protein PKW55_03930 [Spirochaetota bacterium]|nr:hypothetical protein [Spirochaetota bacterium]HOM38016.1 hypothetical protein [Spirochaetota bacterium]HPQ48820.1 hypothetical protein [Spirochaetota bacterium]
MDINEALDLLENAVNRLENYLINLTKEKDFLIEEIEKNEKLIERYRRAKEVTIEKLKSIKEVIKRNTFESKEEATSGIKITMVDDE